MNPTWIQNEDETYRCTRCGTASFRPGLASCSCPSAGSPDADAPGFGSFRAESRLQADSGATGLPAGGLSYWERRLVELDRAAEVCRKQLYRDRKAAHRLADGGETFMAARDSVRLRKECAVADSKIIADQRKGVAQGYEMAKEREKQHWVVRQERTAKGLALIRAGRYEEALLELEGATN